MSPPSSRRTSSRINSHNDDQEITQKKRYETDNNKEDPEQASNNNSSGHKKKKVKIMSASLQTEADRRTLRYKQRELHSGILTGSIGGKKGRKKAAASGDDNDNHDDDTVSTQDSLGGEAEGKVDSKEFQNMRKKNNDLWEEVRYTREAVLDSENMELIARKAAQQAESIVQVPRYDANRLAQCLVKKASVRSSSGTTYFCWKGFGFQTGVCFNSLPTHISFLNGPLDTHYQKKERKKNERPKKQQQNTDNEEEERPEDLDQTVKKETDGNELSAVEAHMNIISKTLNRRCKEEREAAEVRKEEYLARLSQQIVGQGDKEQQQRILQKKQREYHMEASKVDAVQNLFNPQSFTQTVENIFHFSFLVKENKAAISVRSAEEAMEYGGAGPGPVIRPVPYEDVVLPPRQAIVSLTMKDWRDMCQAYEVEASDVPHRGKTCSNGSVREKRKSSS